MTNTFIWTNAKRYHITLLYFTLFAFIWEYHNTSKYTQNFYVNVNITCVSPLCAVLLFLPVLEMFVSIRDELQIERQWHRLYCTLRTQLHSRIEATEICWMELYRKTNIVSCHCTIVRVKQYNMEINWWANEKKNKTVVALPQMDWKWM